MLKNQKFALLLALLLGGSMWFYVQRVLIPYQEADAAAQGRPRGILSDLYPRWVGTRELWLHQRDPYSTEVTQEIQRGYYGHVLDSNRPSDPKDEQRFAYPVYIIFLLAPVAAVPFPAVQTAFTWILAILTGLSVLLWLRVLRWRPSLATLSILMVLTLCSFAAIQGIKLQQLSLLVSCLIAACTALIVGGHLGAAGVLLALASIKPQLAILPAGWLMLWAVGRWQERQRLVWAFAGTMTLLIGGGEYFLPGWIPRFTSAIVAYTHYTGGGSLLDVLATPAAGAALGVLLVIATFVVCWRLRNIAKDSAAFQLVMALVLAVTVVVVPMTAPYNQVLLLPAIFLIARSWKEFYRKKQFRVAGLLAALIIFWPWIASAGLFLASFVLPPTSVQKAWAVPLWTSLGIPLVILPLLVPPVARSLRGESPAGAPVQAGDASRDCE